MQYQTEDDDFLAQMNEQADSLAPYFSGSQPNVKQAPQGGALRDLAVGVGSGLLGTAQGLAGLGYLVPGMDSVVDPIYSGLGRAREWVQSKGSDAYQQAAQQFRTAIDQGDGFVDSFGRGVGAIAENPYIAYNLLGEALGSFGGSGVALKALGGLGRLAPVLNNASLAAKTAGVEGLVAAGSTAGQIAEDNPDNYLARLWGIPSGLATGATSYVGGRLAGNLDPDIAVARLLGAGEGPAASSSLGLVKGAVPRAAKGALTELPQEAIQEGSEQMFTNLGTGAPLMEGVGQSAAAGAIMGAVGGGAMGPVSDIGATRRDLNKEATSPQKVEETSLPKVEEAPLPQVDQGVTDDLAVILAQSFATRLANGQSDLLPYWRDLLTNAILENKANTNTAEGIVNLVKTLGQYEIKPGDFFATLGALSASEYKDTALGKAAQHVLEVATGVKTSSLPSSKQAYKNTKILETRVASLKKNLDSIKRLISAPGLSTNQRSELLARRDALKAQLATADAALSGFVTLRNQRAELDARNAAVTNAANSDVDSAELMRQDNVRRQNEERIARNIKSANEFGQMDLLGGGGGQQPSATSAATETYTPTVGENGQLDMFGGGGQRPEQLELSFNTKPDAEQISLDLEPTVRGARAALGGYLSPAVQKVIEQIRTNPDVKTVPAALKKAGLPANSLTDKERDVLRRFIKSYPRQYAEAKAKPAAKPATEANTKTFSDEALKFAAELRDALAAAGAKKVDFLTINKATGRKGSDVQAQMNALGIRTLADLKKAMAAAEAQPRPKSEGLTEAASVSPEQTEETTSPRRRLGDQVENALGKIANAVHKLSGTAPDVVYVENLDSEQTPDEVAKTFRRMAQDGQQVKGLFYQGVVYINPAAHDSELDLMRTYYHEVVGHKGLRAALGEKLNDTLREIADARPIELRHYAQKYGLDLTKEADRLEAAEELVAHRAEALAQDGLLTRLVEMLKAWWADLTGQQLTDAQIMRDLIRPAAGFSAAKRYSSALSIPPTVRYRLGTAPDPTQYPEINDPDIGVSFKPTQSLRDSLRSIVEQTKNYLAFTDTLLNKLLRRIPSTRKLADAWNEQQMLRDTWDVYRQVVGQLYTKLTPSEAERVSKALLEYSSENKMAKIIPTAKKMAYTVLANGTIKITETPLKPNDVELDSTTYDKLSPKEQEVFDAVAEVMSEQLMALTRLELSKVSDAVALLTQKKPAGDKLIKLVELYEHAVSKIIQAHNNQIVSTYVPQIRRGDYYVFVRSKEFDEKLREYKEGGESDTELKKKIDEMKLSADHYKYIGAESEAEAAAIARHYEEQGFIADYKKELEREAEFGVTLQQLIDLFDRIESVARERIVAHGSLIEGLETELQTLIVQLANKKDMLAKSRLRRKNIAGVRYTEIIPNVLDKIRNFGSYYAAAKTVSARIDAIQRMRRELEQLTGQDSAEYVSVFNELMSRTDPSQAYAPDDFWHKFANKALNVSSFWYLLTNASYYALQLTQPWLMSLPVLNGSFDATKTAPQLAQAYKELTKGGLLDDIKAGITEVKFENLANPQHKKLLKELQARKVLDVGMSAEFGVVGGDVAQNVAFKSIHWLHNAARGIELINRAATAIAAYNLRTEQLTKGRTLSAEQREQIHRRAVDYAYHIVYSTHGNYSYANAPKAFRNPVGRVLLQFKKIALIQVELLYDLLRVGWTKPKLSERLVRLITSGSLNIDPALRQKIENREWLTESELNDLRQTIHDELLDTEASDFLEQALASELDPDLFVTKEKAIASRASLYWLLGMNAAVAGTLSLPTIPFFGSVVAAVLKRLDADDDDELKNASVEYVLNDIFGKDVTTFLLHGLAGSALDIDVSSRVGINFVAQLFGALYQNPTDAQGAERFKEILFNLAGPTANLMSNMFTSAEALSNYAETGSERELMRSLVAVAPLGLRNVLTAQMWDREGLTNTVGVTLIKPDEFAAGDIAKKMLGFQPITVSDFWSARTNKEKIEGAVNRKRVLIKRAYFEAYKARDVARLRQLSEMWDDLQRVERQAKLTPSPKVDLMRYVQRKLREEQRSIRGLTYTSRNRQLAEQIARNYGLSSPTGMGVEMERRLQEMGVDPYQTPEF